MQPWLIGWILLVACDDPVRQGRSVSSTTTATPERECATDDDCGLMPSQLNCCTECPPSPPFEAVVRPQIDSLLLELETRCSQRSLVCQPLTCEPVPVGCTATARCAAGRCTVAHIGCEQPVS